jgi:hypothetical protein
VNDPAWPESAGELEQAHAAPGTSTNSPLTSLQALPPASRSSRCSSWRSSRWLIDATFHRRPPSSRTGSRARSCVVVVQFGTPQERRDHEFTLVASAAPPLVVARELGRERLSRVHRRVGGVRGHRRLPRSALAVSGASHLGRARRVAPDSALIEVVDERVGGDRFEAEQHLGDVWCGHGKANLTPTAAHSNPCADSSCKSAIPTVLRVLLGLAEHR